MKYLLAIVLILCTNAIYAGDITCYFTGSITVEYKDVKIYYDSYYSTAFRVEKDGKDMYLPVNACLAKGVEE